jgi:hypothetical protein
MVKEENRGLRSFGAGSLDRSEGGKSASGL